MFESYENAVKLAYFWAFAVGLTLLYLRQFDGCFMPVLQPILRRASESDTFTPPLYGVRVSRLGDSVRHLWYNSSGPYRGVMTARQPQRLSAVGPLFNEGKTLQRKDEAMQEILDYIAAHPGAVQGDIARSLSGVVGFNRARKIIQGMIGDGYILVEKGDYNTYHHYVTGKEYTPAPEPPEPEQKPKRKKGKAPNETKFVYGVKLAGDSPIKIGISANLKSRLNMMQTSHYSKYYVAFAVLTDKSRQVEAELHEAFSDRRLGGEWFDITVAELIAEVESNGYLT